MRKAQWSLTVIVFSAIALVGSSVWAQTPGSAKIVVPGKRPGGSWDDIGPLSVFYESPYPTGGPPLMETYVLSKEKIYIPVIVRKPEGEGPFPTLLCIHGVPGGRGMSWLRHWATVRNREPLERFLKEGYAIAYTDYRMYEEGNSSIGDPEKASDAGDCLAVLRYLKSLPFVDKDRVGIFGVSRGGGLTVRISNVEPVKAIVVGAPSVATVFGYKSDNPEKGSELDELGEEVPDRKINRAMAEANIKNINCPIMIAMGTQDHLISIGKKLNSLLQELGKNVTMKYYQDQPHSFYWGGAGRTDEPGTETRAKLFAEFMDDCVRFFDHHVKTAS